MTSQKVNELTREEWRELGFYYEYNNDEKCWILQGSRLGLLGFCDMLIAYSTKPRNNKLGEHEHFGPYWYLKVLTSDKPEINEHAICGSLTDIARLSEILRHKLNSAAEGDSFIVDSEYSEFNQSKMRFDILFEGVDPATLDPVS